jgi:adenine-specific DNA methylase
MDFCYVWLRKHLAQVNEAFCPSSTRDEQELTVNETEERGIEHFTAGLSEIFTNLTRALKPGGPFAFTYHHNEVQAYLPIAVSILDSGLVCTATLPCPAEMGASIHISGTKSSVIDTIFVCRTTGTVSVRDFQMSSAALEEMLKRDITDLDEAGHRVSPGDARCILLGHMTRLAIWQLRTTWKASEDIDQKLERVEKTLQQIHPLDLLPKLISRILAQPIEMPLFAQSSIEETQEAYGSGNLSLSVPLPLWKSKYDFP